MVPYMLIDLAGMQPDTALIPQIVEYHCMFVVSSTHVFRITCPHLCEALRHLSYGLINLFHLHTAHIPSTLGIVDSPIAFQTPL